MTALISVSVNDLFKRWLQSQLPASVYSGAVDPTAPTANYPAGATPVVAASGNVANATATATMAATASVTNYIAGFEVTGAGATAGLPVTVTITGILGGTISYTYDFAAGALVGNLPLIVDFLPALPASAVNTAIVVSCPASGLGGTNNTVVVHGYRI
jgi:hypothetical protein